MKAIKHYFTIKKAVKQMQILLILSSLFLISHFSSLISVVNAADQKLRVSPAIINVSLSPNKTYTHELTIENLTDKPLPLRASLNDFMIAGEEGGYVFEESQTNPLLSWIQLDETDFILNPKEKKKIKMTINTPQSIALGGYYGILFFEPVYLDSPAQTTRVSSKVGILMLANIGVPDPNAKKAEIATFSTDLLSQDGNLPLLLRVKNISLNFFTAKPILSLKPLISLDASTGEKKVTLEDKILFPGQIRRWTEETVVQDLKPNIYKASMAVSTGNGQFVSTEKYFLVFPLIKVLSIILVLSIIIIGFVKRKKIKKAVIAFIK